MSKIFEGWKKSAKNYIVYPLSISLSGDWYKYEEVMYFLVDAGIAKEEIHVVASPEDQKNLKYSDFSQWFLPAIVGKPTKSMIRSNDLELSIESTDKGPMYRIWFD